LIEILYNLVPGIEFKGCLGESDDFDSLNCYCFNNNFISQGIARDKHLAVKKATRSTSVIIHECSLSSIDATAPMLHGFQTYATFHNTSMDQEIEMLAQSMPVILCFAILKFSCPKIVFVSLPQCPPDRLITSSLILILISTFFVIFTTLTCFLLSYQQIKYIRSCLPRSALREYFNKVLRETMQ
jgi:hypothetical protein